MAVAVQGSNAMNLKYAGQVQTRAVLDVLAGGGALGGRRSMRGVHDVHVRATAPTPDDAHHHVMWTSTFPRAIRRFSGENMTDAATALASAASSGRCGALNRARYRNDAAPQRISESHTKGNGVHGRAYLHR